MSTTKAQKEVLKRMAEGESLCKNGSRHFLLKSNGMATKVRRETFNCLYMGRYVDSNGTVFDVSHYKINEKGRSEIK